MRTFFGIKLLMSDSILSFHSLLCLPLNPSWRQKVPLCTGSGMQIFFSTASSSHLKCSFTFVCYISTIKDDQYTWKPVSNIPRECGTGWELGNWKYESTITQEHELKNEHEQQVTVPCFDLNIKQLNILNLKSNC